MSKIIEDLNWRYATKKFDSTKKINQEDLNTIIEALRLTPTSMGLMPLKFLIIENPEIREKLRVAANGQSQITDASHLIILCSVTNPNETHVDSHVNLTSSVRNIELQSLDGFKNSANKFISNFTLENKKNWTSKQAYIALGLLMSVCAQLRIDATPMEGFNPSEFDEILKLREQNLHSVLACPIGYRHEEDKYQYLKKVRRNNEDLFEIV